MWRKAKADEIIQEEIMQFIRSDDMLGLLGNQAILGGQQLRTDRCIENIEQYGGQSGLGLAGCMADQMADQGLGYGAVDRIHRHMVTVIGGPAQGQFG